MRKLKLPKFESFEDAYNDNYDTVSSYDYFNGFLARIEDEQDFLYGFISTTEYIDDAIVVTDDFIIQKRTKGNLRRTYRQVIKQLYERYKEWVNSLYSSTKGDENE